MPSTYEQLRTMPSTYEQLRTARITANALALSRLGVDLGAAAKPKKGPRARKRRAAAQPATEGMRRSTRTRDAPPVAYFAPPEPEQDESRAGERAAKREQIAQGWRLRDGHWRGERFGAVPGVEEGAVFGAGDFQRLGRREMADTGFFEPFVTPEWLERNGGCYSLILNNDNGLSSDSGETVEYAGAGGRMRGQNRTAPQTFSQTWDSATNKALKLNCDKKLPVRVIRGPKLRGKHGTARTGGGYRYDGLYDVTQARLVPTGPRKLKTAMFTLKKRALATTAATSLMKGAKKQTNKKK